MCATRSAVSATNSPSGRQDLSSRNTFDFVIVGAGSAGCVLANRLSADRRCRVLVIEGGPDTREFIIRMPKGFGKLLFDTKRVRRFQTEPEPGSGGEAESWPRGIMVGGSSCVNGMFYTRGQPQDYDDWVGLGAIGWGWPAIGRCFKELEDHELGADAVRGVGGPLHVSKHPHPHSLCDAFIQAGTALGLPERQDINQPDQRGIGYVPFTIKDGVRADAAAAFLDPIRSRDNLTIWPNCLVERVVFEGRRAVGVQCLKDGERVLVHAAGEVILAAGAIQSPQLLQVSGAGRAELLSSLGIPLVHDLPQVGRNLREHRMLVTQFRLNQPISLNPQFRGVRFFLNLARYWLTRGGIMATGSHDAVAFFSTDMDRKRPDAELVMAPLSVIPGKLSMCFEREHGMQIFGYQLRPRSHGVVEIRSGDSADSPRIQPNYLSAPEDRVMSGRILRYIRKLVAQPPLAQYVSAEVMPGGAVQSDDDALAFHQTFGGPVMHVAGTCRIGPEGVGVVDERLRVRGLDRLRVVDCSVMPTLVSGHTNGPVMAIAWRAAELIREDWQ